MIKNQSSLKECTTLLFDLDGTLFDSRDYLTSTLVGVLKEHFGDLFSYEQAIRYYEIGFFQMLIDHKINDYQRVMETFHNLKELRYHECCKPFTGVVEGLKTLKKQGFRLGVISNQRKTASLNAIKHNGLEDLFEYVITYEDVSEAKPAPEGILKALRELGADKRNTAMIGDSYADVGAAKNAGIRSVLFHWYKDKNISVCGEADFTFRSFQDFLHAINE